MRIRDGQDANRNNELDPAETASTSYVCNGQPAASNIAPVTTTIDAELIINSAIAVTANTASITTPGSGSVLVFSAAEIFCTAAMGGTPACPSGSTFAYIAPTSTAGD